MRLYEWGDSYGNYGESGVGVSSVIRHKTGAVSQREYNCTMST